VRSWKGLSSRPMTILPSHGGPARIVLLAGEQRLIAPAIARVVREADQTVRT